MLSVSSKAQSCMYLSLIDIKVWLLVFQAASVPKSLPVKARQTTLTTGHGKTHLSPTNGDRRNIPGRVNEMLAERVLLLCSSQA